MGKHTVEINEDTKIRTAFLVGMQNQGRGPEEAASLTAELGELCDTLGLEIVGSIIAKQREPNPRLLIGQGKADEIIETAGRLGAEAIIFDDELSPSQQRNWEKLSELPVIDRQEVILDIFAEHARTSEAVLQVELARANYTLPRLKRRWTHLNRQRGRAGGMGLRGEGEQQIEEDSRMVRMRIAKLQTQLAEVQRHRIVQRSRRLRKPVPVASIVGYTNAGKSSLLNAMTQSDVLVADKLFATLDPTVRRFTLPGGQCLLLADTVGFIRNLPHSLVEAFKSTLEETVLADHIIEVLDASTPGFEERHETTVKVLEEIGAKPREAILVMNKVDLLPDTLTRQRLERRFPDALMCSARTGEGLDALARRLEAACDAASVHAELLVPHTRHDSLARIREASSILSERYEEEGVYLNVKIPRAAWPLAVPFQIDGNGGMNGTTKQTETHTG